MRYRVLLVCLGPNTLLWESKEQDLWTVSHPQDQVIIRVCRTVQAENDSAKLIKSGAWTISLIAQAHITQNLRST